MSKQRDPEVLVFQRRFKDLGLYDGEIDGDFGPRTLKAGLAAVDHLKVVPPAPATSVATVKPGDVIVNPTVGISIATDADRASATRDNLIALLKEFEGFRAKAYWDAKAYSIGYGTQTYPNGKPVKKGDTCTRTEALEFLEHDIDTVRIPAIMKLVKVPLRPNQLNALVSFAYNVGLGALEDSTLLRSINAGSADAERIRNLFADYGRSDGKVNPTLVRRRAAEAKLYLA